MSHVLRGQASRRAESNGGRVIAWSKMLAAGRNYGQGLARSALSASRRSRLIAPGPGGGSLSRVASATPVSAQVARHSGGGVPRDDGPLTAEEDQNTPWLKYQRNMYQRTGLQGFETRRRRRRLGVLSPTTASETAGPSKTAAKTDGFKFQAGPSGVPGKAEALSPAPSSLKAAATPAAMAPAPSTVGREIYRSDDGGSCAKSSDSSATAPGDPGLQTAQPSPASVTTSTPAEQPSQTRPPPSPPGAEPVIPRSPWESSHSGGVGGSVDKVKSEQVAEMEREYGTRIGQDEGGAVGGDGNSREAALNAELERKFGKNQVVEGTASRDGVESPAPRNRDRSRPRGSGAKSAAGEAAAGGKRRRKTPGRVSHYQKTWSAWNNIHAKKNLTRLLVGLGSDYGVKEILGAHHVSEVCARARALVRARVFSVCVRSFLF